MTEGKQKSNLGRLTRLGFSHESECLFVVPKGYRDCTKPSVVVNENMLGRPLYFKLRVKSKSQFDQNKRPTRIWRDVIRVQVDVEDAKGRSLRVFVFGAVFPWLKVNPGDDVFFYGELSEWHGSLQISNPILIPPEDRGKIHPLYIGKVGQVSSEMVKLGVENALPLVDDAGCRLLAELGMLEKEFVKESGYDSPEKLLINIHKPTSVSEGLLAIQAAKSLTVKSVIRRAEANRVKTAIKKSAIVINRDYVTQLINSLPYKLTSDQLTAINDVVTDLRSPFPMKRLLSGDVGTGKSLVYMIPAVAAWKSGANVGIIVPSQLLVSQVAREMKSFFPEIEVTEIVAGVKNISGIAVGTTAILSAAAKSKVVFDFVVCDEQHKFSVSQKEKLLKTHTNFLEATATAIPRTLAIVNYGGMSLSILKECPVQKTIASRIVYGDEKERLFAFVRKVFEAGGQVAVISPLVEDQDESVTKGRLQSVKEALYEWSAQFPNHNVEVLTGRMTPEEKEAVIRRMYNQEIDLLISTVVIETGVTLPSLRALVVVHPERFGVSQLHQLRGRVARKGGRGYFMMFAPSDIEEDVFDRLNLLIRYTNGFDIADHDMEMRGFGDVECGSDSQTGSARSLFWGVKLTKDDLEDETNRSKSH